MPTSKLARKVLLNTLAAFAFSSWTASSLAIEDGLYKFRDAPNTYAVMLSIGGLVEGFIFSIDPDDTWWDEVRGTKIDDTTTRVSDIGRGEGRIRFLELKQDSTNFVASSTSCVDYPEGSGVCDENLAAGLNFEMVMLADGQLKAIFETQWGARIAMFESDGIIVSLFFEFGNNLTENSIVSAYTAKLDTSLLISEIVQVVAPSNGDDEVVFNMVWQISDLVNPQMEIVLSNCSTGGEALDCSELDSFFSQVVRVF